MQTRIAYGRGHLSIALPDGSVELTVAPVAPLPDPVAATARALAHPLGAPPLTQLATGRRHAAIVVSDITRPVPYRTLLPPLLDRLAPRVGRITLLVATGTHRPSTDAEKLEMFGPDALARVHAVVNHDSRDPSQLLTLARRTSIGTRIRVNRLYAEADLKILTGLVEPHFMAGYSGGRKAICPGLLDLATIQSFHGPAFLEHPRAAAGILDGNPCHREALDIARIVGAHFTLNVALDLRRNVVAVAAGHLDLAFDAIVQRVDAYCRAAVPEPADVVLTSAGGDPLDKTFYQTVKGMVAAVPAVRPGGRILIASECSEGIGNPEYADLMFRYSGRHDHFLADIRAADTVRQDQWEFEEQCKVLAHLGGPANLLVATDGIAADTLARLSVAPAAGVATPSAPTPQAQLQCALDALLAASPSARVIAIPQGPYVLATR